MNTYEEKYELLTQDIEVIKKEKENLEEALEVKKSRQSIVSEELSKEYCILMRKKGELGTILDKNIGFFNGMAITVTILTIILAIWSGIKAYNAISPSGIIANILSVLGLLSGVGSLNLIAIMLIAYINHLVVDKIQRKRMEKPKCKELAKNIMTEKEKISEIEKRLDKIRIEMEDITNKMVEQDELMSQKLEELEKLKALIASPIVEPLVVVEEIPEVHRPYTRLKTKENG